jgi:hypothetical protein
MRRQLLKANELPKPTNSKTDKEAPIRENDLKDIEEAKCT